MDFLVSWKDRTGRMPLVVHGGRQVGKTWLINRFAEERFKDSVYLNFEADASLAAIFEGNIEPERILNLLEVYFRSRIVAGSTLLFFDEIQACPKALTSLKYFSEQTPQYHVVAAGSLFGVSVHREDQSFPVGKVELATLHSLDFGEYLLALDEDRLHSAIRESYEASAALPRPLHERALEFYRTYLVTGGMPGVLNAYLRERRVMDCLPAQSIILNSYIADMAKYATASETTRLMACFDSIPAQLAKENRKFQYKVVRRGGSASLFGPSIDWLAASGIVVKCAKVEEASLPLEAYRDLGSFKLYMADTGLLTAKSGISPHSLLAVLEESTFAGAIAENFVAQSLVALGHRLYYWESSGQAEMDFIIPHGDKLIPIEVKAGIHTRSRSLSVYRERFRPEQSLRLSAKNFGLENGIRSVPLYAAFCL